MPNISISDIYNKYISSLANKTANASDNSKTSSTAGTAKGSTGDTLDLTSSAAGLSEYLNYNAGGKYSSTLSLTDYLNAEDSDVENNDTSDMLDSSTDSFDSLLGVADNSNDNSLSNTLNSIADAKINAINSMIADALGKKSDTKKSE